MGMKHYYGFIELLIAEWAPELGAMAPLMMSSAQGGRVHMWVVWLLFVEFEKAFNRLLFRRKQMSWILFVRSLK